MWFVKQASLLTYLILVCSKQRRCGYWIVFRNGQQRVLLFTTNSELKEVIVSGSNEERPKYNLSVSLQSIGLSLVNDTLGLEVAYIGITQ